VGYRYARSWPQALQQKLKLETDAVDVLSAAIRGVRKGGTVSIIGDYVGFANQFPIGALMEKGITTRSGQVQVQRLRRPVLERIQRGQIDPSFLITHHMPLDQAPEAYRMFDHKEPGVIKIALKP
jgi:threonine dehydrogenase-like Zn-dependent dehydrogenase